MNARPTDIVVLGAGLTGAGTALELVRRGFAVTLIERDAGAIRRASLRNEGKIHFGFIYANDRSFATAALQLEGALRFRSALDRWVGEASWLALSTPFQYLVAFDSVVSVAALAAHYAAVEARYRERLAADPRLDYLGERPDRVVRPLTGAELAAHFTAGRFQSGFATAERAVDTEALGVAVRRAIAGATGLTFLPSHLVRSVAATSGGFRIEGDGPDGPWGCDARQVVNATWEQRLALDRQIGLAPPEHLLHRLKYRVIARLPRELHGAPSVSMVLGRYGDVVVRTDGTAYLSWYPAGLRGWSHEVAPPADWESACAGNPDPALAREVAAGILAGIESWYPGMGRSEPLLVDAGAIVALGTSDVDDAASALHDRTRIGVSSHGGWHSVDPGKLTTAPMFALEAADRVEAIAQSRAT